MFIEHAEGKRELWGRESSLVEAMRMAEELQLDLRIMSYVRQMLDVSLKSIFESICEDMPKGLVDEILYEELCQLVQRASLK